MAYPPAPRHSWFAVPGESLIWPLSIMGGRSLTGGRWTRSPTGPTSKSPMPQKERLPVTLNEWMESGEYLPLFLRDFHHQKDVFKWLDSRVSNRRKADIEKRGYAMIHSYDWRSHHILVIDFFLWYMAIHGWTLQRSRKNFDFADWEKSLKEPLHENR